MEEKFSVYQFFGESVDSSYELYKERVNIVEALFAAKQLITSVGSKIGTTQRVIITDSGDSIVFEWLHGEGVVFPSNDQ